MTEILSILTVESSSDVIASGSTQPWSLNKARAARCKYVVLCRNARKSKLPSEPHGSPFMVGRIRDLLPSTHVPGRWAIRLVDYAEVSWPPQAFARKPISYRDESQFVEDAGGPFAFDDLDFRPMPTDPLPREVQGTTFQLTIAGARAWLAANLSLPESSIDITIRA